LERQTYGKGRKKKQPAVKKKKKQKKKEKRTVIEEPQEVEPEEEEEPLQFYDPFFTHNEVQNVRIEIEEEKVDQIDEKQSDAGEVQPNNADLEAEADNNVNELDEQQPEPAPEFDEETERQAQLELTSVLNQFTNMTLKQINNLSIYRLLKSDEMFRSKVVRETINFRYHNCTALGSVT